MADKDDAKEKKKKKSKIASLDLTNYKAKYTDSYGLGKPNEVDLDNFLVAEPDKKSEPAKPAETPVEKPPAPAKPVVAKPVETKKPEVEKKPEPKIEPVIDTKVDEDFERRVNAVAEDDFYDEKPAQKVTGTFRSNAVKKRSSPIDEPEDDEDDSARGEARSNRKLNLREPIKVNVRHEVKDRNKFDEEVVIEPEPKKPPRRTESYGAIISAVALVYSIIAKDKPLVFLSVSLLLYLSRSIIAAPFGKHSQSIENAIKGFSMALFVGAIIFIFL